MITEVGPERLEELIGPLATALGLDLGSDWAASAATLPELDIRLAALDAEDRITAGAASYTLELTTPGGFVSAAALAMVSAKPTHTRRGLLRQLVEQHLQLARQRCRPVALLWASESSIYRRFGYGVATMALGVEIDQCRAAFVAPPASGFTTKLVDAAEAAQRFPPVWEAVRPHVPGMTSRSLRWWETRRLDDPPWRRGAQGALQRVLLEREGKVEAYGLYRLVPGWSRHGLPTGTTTIEEVVAQTAEAERATWGYLLNLDLVERVHANLLAIDNPLPLLLADPRRLQPLLRDGLWLRLIDVQAALEARTYGPGTFVFELRDDLCPWNAGCWRLDGTDATCTKVQATPELKLDASALASVYLGGASFDQLMRAGCVVADDPSTIERADRTVRTSRAPWCPELF